MKKFVLKPGLYDAIQKLAKHCGTSFCENCELNEDSDYSDSQSCILRQIPEDWNDYILIRDGKKPRTNCKCVKVV